LVPQDKLVEALLEEAERVGEEIRAAGDGGDGGPVVVKGAGRRLLSIRPP
jgi:hypothetical protein